MLLVVCAVAACAQPESTPASRAAADDPIRTLVARLDRLGAFALTTMLLGVAVSLISGSPRFMLARRRGSPWRSEAGSWPPRVDGAC